MALSTIVKVGNVSNLSDARYCAGMGVHYLGFSLDPLNAAYIDPTTFKSIREWVVGPSIVGELPEPGPENMGSTLEHYNLDCLEISDPATLAYFARYHLPLILRVDISAYPKPEDMIRTMNECREKVIFFLVERSGTSIIQLRDILKLADHFKLMIGFDIDKNRLRSWLDHTEIMGISLKGGIEEVPGFKDYDELADILESIEVD